MSCTSSKSDLKETRKSVEAKLGNPSLLLNSFFNPFCIDQSPGKEKLEGTCRAEKVKSIRSLAAQNGVVRKKAMGED